MMKMSMADQVKINLNPFQSVIDSLAIDPQRGRQLIHRLPLHGGGDYPPFLKVEGALVDGKRYSDADDAAPEASDDRPACAKGGQPPERFPAG